MSWRCVYIIWLPTNHRLILLFQRRRRMCNKKGRRRAGERERERERRKWEGSTGTSEGKGRWGYSMLLKQVGNTCRTRSYRPKRPFDLNMTLNIEFEGPKCVFTSSEFLQWTLIWFKPAHHFWRPNHSLSYRTDGRMDNLEHNDYVSNLTTLESADTSGVLMKRDTWQITANIKSLSENIIQWSDSVSPRTSDEKSVA